MLVKRSTAIGLATVACIYCHGEGTRIIRYGKEVACNCAFRMAFRGCLNRFRECTINGAHASTVSLEMVRGRQGNRVYSRKNEEYMADFFLVSRRVLTEPDFEIFRLHFLLGGDWRFCCRTLRMDRGLFFHAVYRIEQILGRTFAELEPYHLWPLDEYFGGTNAGPTPLLIDTLDAAHVDQVFPDRLEGPSKRSEGGYKQERKASKALGASHGCSEAD